MLAFLSSTWTDSRWCYSIWS